LSGSPRRYWVWFGTACAGAALVVLAASPLLVRERHPVIHVRWQGGLDAAARQAIERQLALQPVGQTAPETWRYELTDASVDTIRALVTHADVEDTHFLDRTTFTIAPDAGAGERRPGPLGTWSPSLAFGIADYGPLALLLLAAAAAACAARPRLALQTSVTARSMVQRGATLLTRGIPDLSAEALGLFRIVYAVWLVYLFTTIELRLEAGIVPADGQLGWGWLGWLASRPDLMVWLRRAIVGLLMLVAIGMFTRVAYLLAAMAMTTWILVWIESQHSNAHVWLALLLMIPCLLTVRMDVALSVDEMLRRRRGTGYGPGHHGRSYGFAVWIPGLILGTIWLSAAYAKLAESGLEWILGGAVKYHWVIDAGQAEVDWGLWVAGHHWAAVLMSFLGICFESVFILAVFARTIRWRMLLASTGLALLVGFHLFQGVSWALWQPVWASFFIPWESIANTIRPLSPARAARPAVPPARLRAVHWMFIGLVCLHAPLSLPAGFGRFESYATTYASIEAFNTAAPNRNHLWVGYGTPGAIEISEEAVVSDAILRLSRGERLPPDYPGTIRQFADTMARPRLGTGLSQSPLRITLTQDQTTFDWDAGRFSRPGPDLVIGTLDVESMTLTSID